MGKTTVIRQSNINWPALRLSMIKNVSINAVNVFGFESVVMEEV